MRMLEVGGEDVDAEHGDQGESVLIAAPERLHLVGTASFSNDPSWTAQKIVPSPTEVGVPRVPWIVGGAVAWGVVDTQAPSTT
jgi:hypothetical protein